MLQTSCPCSRGRGSSRPPTSRRDSLTESLPDTRVRLTARWLTLSDAARAGMSEWGSAATVLRELAESTSLTSYLTVLRDGAAMCVDWAPARAIDILALRPGRSLPLHAGAAGRTLLAFGVDAEAYLGGAPFPALTERTLVTAGQLRDDLVRTRQRGFAVSDGDVTAGIGAIGVPVLDAAGAVVGCLSLGGLADELLGRREELVALLLAAAHEIVGARG
jgi:IclR family acetate operon transcriptional repressor